MMPNLLLKRDGMNALIMCGGMGRRLDVCEEKPLLRIAGRYMIDYVIEALYDCARFSRIFAMPGPYTQNTARHLANFDFIKIIKSQGKGYSADLTSVMRALSPDPVFVVSADLPLLSPSAVNKILSVYSKIKPLCECLSVICNSSFISNLGIQPSIVFDKEDGQFCHTGVTIIDTKKAASGYTLKEQYVVINRKEIAVNVNTASDARICEKLLRGKFQLP